MASFNIPYARTSSRKDEDIPSSLPRTSKRLAQAKDRKRAQDGAGVDTGSTRRSQGPSRTHSKSVVFATAAKLESRKAPDSTASPSQAIGNSKKQDQIDDAPVALRNINEFTEKKVVAKVAETGKSKRKLKESDIRTPVEIGVSEKRNREKVMVSSPMQADAGLTDEQTPVFKWPTMCDDDICPEMRNVYDTDSDSPEMRNIFR